MDVYDLGDRPTVRAEFRERSVDPDVLGVLATPTGRVAQVLRPDGTQSELAAGDITVVSVGVLDVLLPVLDQRGPWRVRVAGTAGVVAAQELEFLVRDTRFVVP